MRKARHPFAQRLLGKHFIHRQGRTLGHARCAAHNPLVAQAESPMSDNQLRIVMLDVESGGEILLSAAVQLPQGTQIRIDDGLGTTFRTSVYLHDDGAIVSWEYTKQEIGGPPPGPGAKALVTAGVARIDLETAGAYPLEADEVLPEREAQLPDRIVRLIETGALQGNLWKSGNVLGTIERTGGKGETRTVLRRWQGGTGKPMPDVILSADGFTYRYALADGRIFLQVNVPARLNLAGFGAYIRSKAASRSLRSATPHRAPGFSSRPPASFTKRRQKAGYQRAESSLSKL